MSPFMKPSQRLRANPSRTFLQLLTCVIDHVDNMRQIDLVHVPQISLERKHQKLAQS